MIWNDLLEEAAKNHSKDMNKSNKLTHTGGDDSSPGDRITQVGYTWGTYAENIAWNYTTEESVIRGWLDREGHCKI